MSNSTRFRWCRRSYTVKMRSIADIDGVSYAGPVHRADVGEH
jgi:hypothetical protein